MPSKGGLFSHLTYLVYISYLGKLSGLENHKVSGNGISFWRINKLITLYLSIMINWLKPWDDGCEHDCSQLYIWTSSRISSHLISSHLNCTELNWIKWTVERTLFCSFQHADSWQNHAEPAAATPSSSQCFIKIYCSGALLFLVIYCTSQFTPPDTTQLHSSVELSGVVRFELAMSGVWWPLVGVCVCVGW